MLQFCIINLIGHLKCWHFMVCRISRIFGHELVQTWYCIMINNLKYTYSVQRKLDLHHALLFKSVVTGRQIIHDLNCQEVIIDVPNFFKKSYFTESGSIKIWTKQPFTIFVYIIIINKRAQRALERSPESEDF